MISNKVIVFIKDNEMLKLVRKGGNVKFESYNTDIMDTVRKSLTFYKEGAQFSKLVQEKLWDGYVKFYDKKNQTFPLGMTDIVTTAMDRRQIQYQKIDFIKQFHPTLPYAEVLYEHQKLALNEFFKYCHGFIKVPTRGGKTMIASEAMRLILNDLPEFNVLFIVESQLLFEQAIDDISDYLKIKRNTIGRIKEGNVDIQQITVATVQSIQAILNSQSRIKKSAQKTGKSSEEVKLKLKSARDLKLLLKEYLKIVNFLIVDEVHEFSNPDRTHLIHDIAYADFYLFLSATPLKSEDLFANLNIKTVAGIMLYEIHEQVLKDRGILSQDRIMLINMDHNKDKNINVNEDSGYQEYVREVITHNDRRNTIIVNITNICRRLNLKTLVLFVFKKHGNWIQSITGDVFLSGDDKMTKRLSNKTAYLKKKGGVMLVSDIFKKGITLSEVQVLYNAGGGLEQSNVIQKKGRALGITNTKKKALIIDFIDDYKYFNIHSLSRIQVYEESVGIDGIVIFDPEDGDFYRDIQEFLKQWFEL